MDINAVFAQIAASGKPIDDATYNQLKQLALTMSSSGGGNDIAASFQGIANLHNAYTAAQNTSAGGAAGTGAAPKAASGAVNVLPSTDPSRYGMDPELGGYKFGANNLAQQYANIAVGAQGRRAYDPYQSQLAGAGAQDRIADAENSMGGLSDALSASKGATATAQNAVGAGSLNLAGQMRGVNNAYTNQAMAADAYAKNADAMNVAGNVLASNARAVDYDTSAYHNADAAQAYGANAYANAQTAQAAGQQAIGAAGQAFGLSGQTYDTSQQGLSSAYGTQQSANQATALARASALGQGPSAAQAQLQAARDQAIQTNLQMAASARGGGGAIMAAERQAQAQNAMQMQQTANESALLRAQEQQQGYANYLNSIGQQNGAQAGVQNALQGITQAGSGVTNAAQGIGNAAGVVNQGTSNVTQAGNLVGALGQNVTQAAGAVNQGMTNVNGAAANVLGAGSNLTGAANAVTGATNATTGALGGLNAATGTYGNLSANLTNAATAQGAAAGNVINGYTGLATAYDQQRQGEQADNNLALQQQQANDNKQNTNNQLAESTLANQLSSDTSRYGADKGVSIAQMNNSTATTNAIIGGVASGVGTLVGGLAALSDVRLKTGIRSESTGSHREAALSQLSRVSRGRDEPTDADAFLDTLAPHSYEYKNDHDAPGAPGRYLGILAQNIEKGPTGGTIVMDTPRGKAINNAAMVSALAAGQGRLHERLRELEAARGAR